MKRLRPPNVRACHLRRPRFTPTFLAFGLVLVTGPTAQADALSHDSIALGPEGMISIGGPLSFLGLGIQARWRGLSALVGSGFGFQGVHRAAHLRWKPSADWAFDVGIGGSMGHLATPFLKQITADGHSARSSEGEQWKTWNTAYILNIDLGGTWRAQRGYMRWFAGIGNTLNSPDSSCRGEGCSTCSGLNCDDRARRRAGGSPILFPYIGLSCGFELFQRSLQPNKSAIGP